MLKAAMKPRFRFLCLVACFSLIWMLATFLIRHPPLSPPDAGGAPIAAADDISNADDVHFPAKKLNSLRAGLDQEKGQLVWSVLTKLEALLAKNSSSAFKVELRVSPNNQDSQDSRTSALNGQVNDLSTTTTTTTSSIKVKGEADSADSLLPIGKPFNATKIGNWLRKMQPEFKSATSPEQKDLLFDLTEKFSVLCHLLNITYFMYGGTLLGSYRHHDLIPWDDDIDLIVDRRQQEKLYNSLLTLPSDYQVIRAGSRFKFFHKKSQRTSRYPWKWPYIDISFYYQNDTHIWDSSKEFRKYAYYKNIIFPLHDRPFGRMFLKAPRDSFAALKSTYRNSDCSTYFYSHKYETNKKKHTISLPCRSLGNVVGFVHRTPSPNGVHETLMMGQRVIHSMDVAEPTYAITSPFRLELLQRNPRFR